VTPELRGALADYGVTRLYSTDFEYQQPDGDNSKPNCLAYRCLLTGRSDTVWLWDNAPACPFEMTEREAFVGYNFAAEAGCFAALGWPKPLQVLDLYLEYLQVRNTWPPAVVTFDEKKERKRLLDALHYFGLETRDVARKAYWQERAMQGGPWASGEPESMMAYCLEDVDDVGRLLDPLAQKQHLDDVDNLGHAFLRGRYAVAVAAMVRNGVPMDGPRLTLARKHRARIQSKLVERFDTAGVYDADDAGVHFRRERMTALIEEMGAGAMWPRTDTGRMYAVKTNVLREMAESLPDLQPLAKLRGFLGKVHPFDFTVGADGRARTSLFPFGTKTGRNNPSKYIFGADKGLRGFIKPGRGQAVAYLDWERNELAVGAYLSGDDNLLRLAKHEDPYIHLGVMFGIIPKGGTKDSHPEERDRCKPVLLGGTLYGMGPETIARKLEIPFSHGRAIWRQVRAEYRPYWQWQQDQIDWAAAGQPLRTPYGHTLSFGPHELVAFSAGTAGNFLVQGVAAEIMRFAAILATEADIVVCGSVHDAFLIEAEISQIESEVARMKACMAQAVEIVLGPGRSIAVDHIVTAYPHACTWRKSEIFDIIVAEITAAEIEEGRNVA
jgi:DNA polymerase I